MIMAKTQTVHTRVTEDIKTQADRIFSSLGLTTSQAIMLFLTAAVNHNGMPFELSLPKKEDQDLSFALSVATVDGVTPSDDAQRIMRLYSRGEIDYETAQFAIGRLYQQ
jgi:addiction module RelB/DinJ family antitoxin